MNQLLSFRGEDLTSKMTDQWLAQAPSPTPTTQDFYQALMKTTAPASLSNFGQQQQNQNNALQLLQATSALHVHQPQAAPAPSLGVGGQNAPMLQLLSKLQQAQAPQTTSPLEALIKQQAILQLISTLQQPASNPTIADFTPTSSSPSSSNTALGAFAQLQMLRNLKNAQSPVIDAQQAPIEQSSSALLSGAILSLIQQPPNADLPIETNENQPQATNDVEASKNKPEEEDALTQTNREWNETYGALSEFRHNHGHSNVPPRYVRNRHLAHWVAMQRKQYWQYRKGKPSSMTPEKVDKLNSLDFVWSIRSDPEEIWNFRVDELIAFRDAHGHCLVPQQYSGNPQLGTWVNTQRRHFKLMKDGKPSSMTPARVKRLESIGFSWAGKRGAPYTKNLQGNNNAKTATVRSPKK